MVYPDLDVALTFPGCNLSPLLFSIFIDSLGTELNLSKLGIPLSDVNISALFFADDIVLIGKSIKALDHLMSIARRFFSNHRLKISETKSKVMMYNATTGQTSFSGSQEYSEMTLQQVVVFKYLGVDICSSPRGLFRAYNERVKAKARQYLQCVLALVRAGPDRADLAHTLWTCCALPVIMYGCEVGILRGRNLADCGRICGSPHIAIGSKKCGRNVPNDLH